MNKEISRPKNPRCFEIVIDKISNMISTGELKYGDKLPSERELAEMLNVSRVPVREAIKILEYLGVLEINGHSTVVKNLNIQNLLAISGFQMVASPSSILDLMEVRIILESEAARLAASRRTNEDIILLSDLVQKSEDYLEKHMDLNASIIKSRELSEDFHYAIIKAAHNSILESLYTQLYNLLAISKQYTISDTNGLSPESINLHEKIFEAIVSRNETAAKELMSQHITAVSDRIVRKIILRPKFSSNKNSSDTI